MEDLRYFIWIISMKNTVIYIHGKNGSADEAKIYKPVFSEYEVIGLDYKAETPWQAKAEFPNLFDKLCAESDESILISSFISS